MIENWTYIHHYVAILIYKGTPAHLHSCLGNPTSSPLLWPFWWNLYQKNEIVQEVVCSLIFLFLVYYILFGKDFPSLKQLLFHIVVLVQKSGVKFGKWNLRHSFIYTHMYIATTLLLDVTRLHICVSYILVLYRKICVLASTYVLEGCRTGNPLPS